MSKSNLDNKNNHIYALLVPDGQFTALSDAQKQGDSKYPQFYKQIVKFGNWVDQWNPNATFKLDKAWAETVVANFESKVVGRVAVPLSHTDLPEFNAGEVLSLEIKNDGLYAVLEIRDQPTADKILNDTIWDVSISFDWEYVDKKTGDEVGPTLLHVALVNNPYLKGMKPFEALSEILKGATMLSEGKVNMSKTIKNEHDYPVTVTYKDGDEDKTVEVAAGAEIEVPEAVAETVEKQITDAVKPEEGDGGEGDGDGAGDGDGGADGGEGEGSGDGSDGDGAGDEGKGGEGDKNLSETEKLKRENAQLKAEKALSEATKKYETALAEGKVVPAQKDQFIALAMQSDSKVQLSDGKETNVGALLADFIKSAKPVVKFGEEGGDGGDGGSDDDDDVELSETDRTVAKKLGVSEEDFKAANKESNN